MTLLELERWIAVNAYLMFLPAHCLCLLLLKIRAVN